MLTLCCGTLRILFPKLFPLISASVNFLISIYCKRQKNMCLLMRHIMRNENSVRKREKKDNRNAERNSVDAAELEIVLFDVAHQ